MTEQQLLGSLLEGGFDASHRADEGGVWVGCHRCEALVINGVATHERGCPNAGRRVDADEEDR